MTEETRLPWLSAVPALLACARLGSATAAAKELATTTATVIRRLTALEEALSVRLFERTATGLIASPALEQVLPWAEQVEGAALAMERQVRGFESQPVGVVRLALLPMLSSRFVAPVLNTLLSKYPGLVIELSAASAVVDLLRREADLAIRAFRPEQGDLIAKPLAMFAHAVVCSPALVDKCLPQSLRDLPWLAWDRGLAESRWLDAVVPDAKIVLRSSDPETLLRAAQAGLGALFVGESVAAVAGGLIHAPVPTPAMPTGQLWLVAHRALRHVPRVAAVWQWLLEEFRITESRAVPTLPPQRH